jgi:hypothetical protein
MDISGVSSMLGNEGGDGVDMDEKADQKGPQSGKRKVPVDKGATHNYLSKESGENNP